MSLHLLGVGEDIVALLRVDSRQSIQQAALETEGDGCAWLEDGLACLLNVHFLNCLS